MLWEIEKSYEVLDGNVEMFWYDTVMEANTKDCMLERTAVFIHRIAENLESGNVMWNQEWFLSLSKEEQAKIPSPSEMHEVAIEEVYTMQVMACNMWVDKLKECIREQA